MSGFMYGVLNATNYWIKTRWHDFACALEDQDEEKVESINQDLRVLLDIRRMIKERMAKKK